MTTKKSLILSLLKIDLVAYPILVPLIGYFAFFTGGYGGSDVMYLPIDVGIGALMTLIVERIIMDRKVSRLMRNVDDERYDRLQVKKDLLAFPMNIGLQYVFEWFFGVSIVLLMLFIHVDLTLMNVMPFLLLLPILAFVNYNVGLYVSENSLEEILSRESIRDVELQEGSYKKSSLNRRIALLTTAASLVPVVIFGYMLYMVNAKQIVMDNFWFHVGFIGFLSGITNLASINLLMKNVTKSTSVLMSSLKSIKEGNLAITGVPMITSSEIGEISQNANALIIKLRQVISLVKEAMDLVNESSLHIKDASMTLSRSAGE